MPPKDPNPTDGMDPQLAAQFQQFLAQQAQNAQPQPTQPQLTPEQIAQLQALLAQQQAATPDPTPAATQPVAQAAAQPSADQAAAFQQFLAAQNAAAQPAAAQPAAAQPAPSAPKKGRKGLALGIIGGVAAVAIAAAALFAFGIIKLPGTEGQGEIFLEAADDPGENPFSDISFATAPALAPAVVKPATGVTAIASAPGLYGGTGNSSMCDARAQAQFLVDNPQLAAAFVTALNKDSSVALLDGSKLSTANLTQYLSQLTGVLLISDTRVTNHGFENGQPTTLQSVLQAGTAVLVDQFGVPRVKCNCGNPLLPPVAVATTPKFTGNPWPGFVTTPDIITASKTVIETITTVDPTTGERTTTTTCSVLPGVAIPAGCFDPATVTAGSGSTSSPTNGATPDFTVSAGGIAPSGSDISSNGNPRQYFGCNPNNEVPWDAATNSYTGCLGGTVVRVLDTRTDDELIAQFGESRPSWGGECATSIQRQPYNYNGWTGTLIVEGACTDGQGIFTDIIALTAVVTKGSDRITVSVNGSQADSAAVTAAVQDALSTFRPIN